MKYGMTSKLSTFILTLALSINTFASNPNDKNREAIILQGETFPPYVIMNGDQVSGLAVDLLKEIDRHLSLSKPEIKIVPWNRTFQALSKGQEFSALLVSESLIDKYKLKRAGPIASCAYSLFTAIDRKKVSTLKEAKDLRSIGVSENSSTERLAKRLGFKNIKSFSHSPIKIEDLLKRRLDAWLGCEASIQYRSCSSKDKRSGILKTLTIGSEDLYIAFSNNTSDAIVQDWNQAIHKVKEQSTYKTLTEQYSSGCKSGSNSLP